MKVWLERDDHYTWCRPETKEEVSDYIKEKFDLFAIEIPDADYREICRAFDDHKRALDKIWGYFHQNELES